MKTSKILQHNLFLPALKTKRISGCKNTKTFFAFKSLDNDIFINNGSIGQIDNKNDFFETISNDIFKDSPDTLNFFKKLLVENKIALSSSVTNNYKNPSSAVGIKLNPNDSDAKILASLTDEIVQGKGVGINFNEFTDPCDKIKKINSYFKYKEKDVKRNPAGIALLSVYHPEIINFITLKDDEEFKNWCFDLSVILPFDFLSKVDKNETITLQDGNSLEAKKIYNTLLNSMLKKGEPGVIFSDNKDYICDSCGACELKENEKLTISHINLAEFFDEKTKLPDYNSIKEATSVLSQAMNKIDSNGCIGIVGYQDLINKCGFKYGTKEAINVLENSLKIIQNESHKNKVKTAISPTGTVSRRLGVSPSIQPNDYSSITYLEQLNTLIAAQKYIDGNISNTIILNNNNSTDDIDKIFRYASSGGLKGFTVFKN